MPLFFMKGQIVGALCSLKFWGLEFVFGGGLWDLQNGSKCLYNETLANARWILAVPSIFGRQRQTCTYMDVIAPPSRETALQRKFQKVKKSLPSNIYSLSLCKIIMMLWVIFKDQGLKQNVTLIGLSSSPTSTEIPPLVSAPVCECEENRMPIKYRTSG